MRNQNTSSSKVRAFVRRLSGLLLLTAIPGFAREHAFTTFTGEDGLSQLTVTALVQDPDGYLWVGTRAGVDRFDGEHFESFDPSDGLVDSVVTDLAVGSRGTIWVATRQGISHIQGDPNRSYTIDDGLPAPEVETLVFGADGTLWAGTLGGLARLRGERFEAVGPETAVGATTVDPSGRLWIGTLDDGVAYLDGESLVPFPAFDPRPVSDLAVDSRGRLWIATADTVEAYEGDRRTVRLAVDNGVPDLRFRGMALTPGRHGEMWIGGQKKILRYLDGETKGYGRDERFPLDHVGAFLEDREGVLWIGGSGGLSRFIGRAFTTYGSRDGLSSSIVRPILRDSRDRLWVGTHRGLSVLENDRWSNFFAADGLPSNYILSLAEDPQGRIWIGTDFGAVYFADGRFQRDPSFLWEGIVGSLEVAADGTLWAATAGTGPVRRIDDRFEAVDVPGDDFETSRLTIDGRQRIWVTGNRGVSRWDGNSWTTFTSEHGLQNARPYFLCSDGNDGIWLDYFTPEGLTHFDGKKARTYTVADGLSDNGVYSLGLDGAGNLWAGTSRGVDRFDGKTFRNYGKIEGYASWESNAGGFLLDRNDTLWFGTAEGLSHFVPELDPDFAAPLFLEIRSLTLDGVPLGDPKAKLAEGVHLEARVGVVTAANRSQVDLRYRLDNFHPEWQSLADGEVSLPNLPAGSYAFEVQGRRYGEPWTTLSSPSFEIRPPLWQTPAGLLAGLALIGLSTFGAVRFRTRRLQKHNDLLEQEVARRSRESEEARRAAERANQAKSDFLAHMSHEIRTPLNAVIGLTSVLQGSELDSRDREMVEAIEQSGRLLLSMVANVLDFSRIEAGEVVLERKPFRLRETIKAALDLVRHEAVARDLALNSRIDDDVPETLVGDSTRFLQILWNLLGNAIKFTEVGKVDLVVSRVSSEDTHRLQIEVTDTGIGIPEERQRQIFERFQQADVSTARVYGGTGLGLAIVRNLVDLLDGEIRVRSRSGEGSTFTVLLPLPDAAAAAPKADA